MTGFIARIVRATTEGHNDARLEAEKDRLVISAWISAPRTPDGMSRRLQQKVLEGQRLKPMDLDDFIDAMKTVADDPTIRADLAALELVAARLGSDLMAMRIGRQIFKELRERRALPAGRLP